MIKPIIVLNSILIAVFLNFYSIFASEGAQSDIRQSMVKVYITYASPDYDNPWNFKSLQQGTGSGCFIGRNRILTNAHVVSDQKFIQVRLFGKSERYSASILAISHEVDLAILVIDDPEFQEEVLPISFGENPNLQNEVLVYGFPEGGDALSITKGVVSRVEHR